MQTVAIDGLLRCIGRNLATLYKLLKHAHHD
jgi:hypothetical protein